MPEKYLPLSAVTQIKTYVDGRVEGIIQKSDVTDIVGTYAELESYDASELGGNDIIKVLSDSTHDGAASYYRYLDNGMAFPDDFLFIGTEGPYYTKAEANASFVSLATDQGIRSDKWFIVGKSLAFLTENGPTYYLMQNSSGTSLSILADGTEVFRFYSAGITSGKSLFPMTTSSGDSVGLDLGSPSNRWRAAYLRSLIGPGKTIPVDSIATGDDVSAAAATLQASIQDVREAAEGKCSSYVLSLTDTIEYIERLIDDFGIAQGFVCLEDGTDITSSISDYEGETIYNSAFRTQNASVILDPSESGYLILESGTSFQTVTGFAYILVKIGSGADSFKPKTGDIFLIVETDVPDRWFSFTSNRVYSFYKMETSKVDISNMVTTDTAQTIIGVKTIANASSPNSPKLQFQNQYATVGIFADGYQLRTDSPLYVDGDLNVAGKMQPTTNGTRDIGASDAKWRDLHLSGNVYLGSSGTTYINTDAYNGVAINIDNNAKLLVRAGTTYINNNLYPLTNGTRDIGTNGAAFRDLYLTGKIDFGSKISGRTSTCRIALDNYDGVGIWSNNVRMANFYDNGIYFAKTVYLTSTLTMRSPNNSENWKLIANDDGSMTFGYGTNTYYAMNTAGIFPAENETRICGAASLRWLSVYTKEISDGTNSVSIADLANLIAYAKAQGWIS